MNEDSEGTHFTILQAIEDNKIEQVKHFIKGGGNVTNEIEGITPLIKATWYSHTEIVRVLIEAGANLNTPFRGGWVALFIASQKGYTEIVKLLLEAKAKKDIQDKLGATPLLIASQSCQTEIVNLSRRKEYRDSQITS